MVASQVFDLLDRFSPSSYIGLEDFADKFSFLYSVMVLLVSTVIISFKSYVFKSIACYLSITPSVGNFDDYMENYCWVHGTVPIHTELLPEDPSIWKVLSKENGVLYYQWVPFVLGLQTLLFFVPRFFWQLFCATGGGIDLEKIMKQSVEISNRSFNEREKEYKSLADVISNTLYLHRDFRSGRCAEWRRKFSDKFAFLIPSKRLGTKLILSYLLIKILYLSNSIGQLFLIQKFLGFNNSIISFSGNLLSHIYSGEDWKVNNYFPRTTFCNVPQVRHVGARNSFTAQCILPVNMLNEKIYTFLFFWIFMVFVVTTLSVPMWIWRMFRDNSRTGLVRKYLKMHSSYRVTEWSNVTRFTKQFLRHDGLFLIIMIKTNTGDVVASNITYQLWRQYLDKYTNMDFGNDLQFTIDRRRWAINLETGEFSKKCSGENTADKYMQQYSLAPISNGSVIQYASPTVPPPQYL